MRLLLGIILYTLYFILYTFPISAASFSLGISPPLTVIEQSQPDLATVSITLENFGDTILSLTPSFRQFVGSNKGNGQVSFVDDDDSFSSLRETFSIRDGDETVSIIRLLPKQKKSLRLSINTTRVEARDYYFSLLFTSIPSNEEHVPNEGSTYSIIRNGVATNILLSVGNRRKRNVTITSFANENFKDKGPVGFSLKVNNENDQLTKLNGEVQIRNMFGQLISRLPLEPTFVLGKSSRYLQGKNNNDLVWSERFLLGPYTAKAIIRDEHTQNTIEKTTTFFAFPLKEATIAFFIFISLFFLVRKVTQYRNR